jgi:uncharacterized protein
MNFLIGFLAGLFGGLVGLGGGVVMIPLMVGIKKLSQQHAHGTSLVVLVFTGIMGAATYAYQGSIDIVASALLASTAIFTARSGAFIAHSLPEWKLKKTFGIFIILVSMLMVLKPYIPHVASPMEGWIKVLILLASGALTGLLSGMMGVGGGSLMVPAMVLMVGMEQHTAQGSSLLAMIPAGAVGAWTHKKLGNVETPLLYGLIPGVMIGTFIGARCAHYLPENILRCIFALVIIWTGIRFIHTSMKMRKSN